MKLLQEKKHALDISRTISPNVRPKMPDHPIPFLRDCGYAMATVLKWEWSYDFGRWGASVRFEDGRECHSYPKENPIAAPFYEPDGSKNPHGWAYVQSPQFPQEKTIACPKCATLDITMVGGATIRGFYHNGYTRCNSCGHFTSETRSPY